MNKISAKEWLVKAWHNSSTAKLLHDVNHYTDIIAVEVHYGIEKSLKAFLAFENKKIPKIYNRVLNFSEKLYDEVCNILKIDQESMKNEIR